MKPMRWIGGLILALTIGGAIMFSNMGQKALPAQAPTTPVNILITGDKVEIFEDKEILAYLRTKGIELKYRTMSDAEMVSTFSGSGRSQLQGVDGMWPTDELMVDRLKEISKANKERETFYTYYASTEYASVVLLSWAPIVEALLPDQTVEKDGASYTVNMPKLLEKINKKQAWQQFGLPYEGSIRVMTPNPRYSGTGVAWLGIITDTYMKGKEYNDKNISGVQPMINASIPQGERLPDDPKELLDRYITGGPGALPIIVASEHGLIEFARSRPEAMKEVSTNMRILYPRPTILEPHPFITKTDAGRDFAILLQRDDQLRRLIRVNHGFRTKETDATDDKSTLNALGIPDRVNSVIGIAPSRVMDQVLQGLPPE